MQHEGPGVAVGGVAALQGDAAGRGVDLVAAAVAQHAVGAAHVVSRGDPHVSRLGELGVAGVQGHVPAVQGAVSGQQHHASAGGRVAVARLEDHVPAAGVPGVSGGEHHQPAVLRGVAGGHHDAASGGHAAVAGGHLDVASVGLHGHARAPGDVSAVGLGAVTGPPHEVASLALQAVAAHDGHPAALAADGVAREQAQVASSALQQALAAPCAQGHRPSGPAGGAGAQARRHRHEAARAEVVRGLPRTHQHVAAVVGVALAHQQLDVSSSAAGGLAGHQRDAAAVPSAGGAGLHQHPAAHAARPAHLRAHHDFAAGQGPPHAAGDQHGPARALGGLSAHQLHAASGAAVDVDGLPSLEHHRASLPAGRQAARDLHGSAQAPLPAEAARRHEVLRRHRHALARVRVHLHSVEAVLHAPGPHGLVHHGGQHAARHPRHRGAVPLSAVLGGGVAAVAHSLVPRRGVGEVGPALILLHGACLSAFRRPRRHRHPASHAALHVVARAGRHHQGASHLQHVGGVARLQVHAAARAGVAVVHDQAEVPRPALDGLAQHELHAPGVSTKRCPGVYHKGARVQVLLVGRIDIRCVSCKYFDGPSGAIYTICSDDVNISPS